MSTKQNLFTKVWNEHRVRELESGLSQLYIGTHLIHEVTSPQAFGMLRDLGLKVRRPDRTFATVDHIVPTHTRLEPYQDPLAQEMIEELRRNCKEWGIEFFDRSEEHTSELQSRGHLVCRLLLEKKNTN